LKGIEEVFKNLFKLNTKKHINLNDIVKMFPKIQSDCIVKGKIPKYQVKNVKIQRDCVTNIDWSRIKI
jgi:hypothetical protein